uniref:mucin-5AC-like n=1 Tax=Erigeron canadensis TaxID=72917 RepID=UPI001CB95AA4|nr:mucin-5AC-like [Erigeron canadensis]
MPISESLLSQVPVDNPDLRIYRAYLAERMATQNRGVPSPRSHRSPSEGSRSRKRKEGLEDDSAPGLSVPSSSSIQIPQSSAPSQKKRKTRHHSKSKSKSKTTSSTFSVPSPLTPSSSSSNPISSPSPFSTNVIRSSLQPIPEESHDERSSSDHNDINDQISSCDNVFDIPERQGGPEGGVEKHNGEDVRSGLGTGQKENDGPPTVETTSREATNRLEAEESPTSHDSPSRHSGFSLQDPVSSLHRHQPRPLSIPHSEDVDIEVAETLASLPRSFAHTIESRSPLRSLVSEHAHSLNVATTEWGFNSQGMFGSPAHVNMTGAGDSIPSSTGNLGEPGSPTIRNIVPDTCVGPRSSETTNVELLLHKSLGTPDGLHHSGHTVNQTEPTVVQTTSTSVATALTTQPPPTAVLRPTLDKGKAPANSQSSSSTSSPPPNPDDIRLKANPAERQLFQELEAAGLLPHSNPQPSPQHSSPSVSSSHHNHSPHHLTPHIITSIRSNVNSLYNDLYVDLLSLDTQADSFNKAILANLQARFDHQQQLLLLKHQAEQEKFLADAQLEAAMKRIAELEDSCKATVVVHHRRDDPDDQDQHEGENREDTTTEVRASAETDIIGSNEVGGDEAQTRDAPHDDEVMSENVDNTEVVNVVESAIGASADTEIILGSVVRDDAQSVIVDNVNENEEFDDPFIDGNDVDPNDDNDSSDNDDLPPPSFDNYASVPQPNPNLSHLNLYQLIHHLNHPRFQNTTAAPHVQINEGGFKPNERSRIDYLAIPSQLFRLTRFLEEKASQIFSSQDELKKIDIDELRARRAYVKFFNTQKLNK